MVMVVVMMMMMMMVAWGMRSRPCVDHSIMSGCVKHSRDFLGSFLSRPYPPILDGIQNKLMFCQASTVFTCILMQAEANRADQL